MIHTVNFTGVKATVRNTNFRFLAIAVLAFAVLVLAGCPNGSGGSGANPSSNEAAATVNGKTISMEEVERAIKQQAQGQESKLSPLELAAARLQVLETLIQNEVLYQKAEKESTVPTDEEVTAEVNKQKTDSHLSQEEFDKQMKQAGFDDKSLRENIKRGLAVKKLVDKVTGKIEPPKDSEIEELFKGNPELFLKKRGVRLAAIVVDPTDSGNGDTTRNDSEASLKVKEILEKIQQGNDFAALAREYSEDPGSKLQGGDLGLIPEDELKKNFGAEIAAGFMNPQFAVGRVTNMIPIMGKGYIFKLQERIEKDENQTLESPGVRQQITDLLINNRKQLLSQSYAAVAMNEAKIENFLAKKVVDNPNELSGARPASANTPDANTNTNSNANTNSVVTNLNTNVAANSKVNTKANTNAAANTTKPATKPANTNAGK
jgi:parvulin-like peptidyl-prolyl isomerase